MVTGPATTETPALVSVIMPFLNAERFIGEAIESVFAQTYRNWELLLIDDGSTDASTATARRYARQHGDRVYYLNHPGHQNRGAASSRNLGIRNARGVYIALLDADDVWLPGKLEQQVELMELHPEAGMLCGATQYWYGWTGRPEDIARDEVVPVGAPQDTVVQAPALATVLYPLGEGASPCVSSLLARRRTIEMVGGFEEAFHGVNQLYEDQVFLTKVYLTSPVFVTSLCCDRYRQHPDSCVSRVEKAGYYHRVREDYLEWFANYLKTQGSNVLVQQALYTSLMRYRHPIGFFLVEFRRNPAAQLKRLAKSIARRVLPSPVRRWLRSAALIG